MLRSLRARRVAGRLRAMPVTVTAPRGLSRLAAPVRALVVAVLRAESRRLGEIAVVLADDDLLHRINAEWRGHDHATDVISFAYDEHEPDAAVRPVTGDLLVSMDRVHVQAARYRVTPGEELARLLVHGALHLCGHDHMRATERRVMREREDALLGSARGAVRSFTAVLGRTPAVPVRTRATSRTAATPRRAQPARARAAAKRPATPRGRASA